MNTDSSAVKSSPQKCSLVNITESLHFSCQYTQFYNMCNRIQMQLLKRLKYNSTMSYQNRGHFRDCFGGTILRLKGNNSGMSSVIRSASLITRCISYFNRIISSCTQSIYCSFCEGCCWRCSNCSEASSNQGCEGGYEVGEIKAEPKYIQPENFSIFVGLCTHVCWWNVPPQARLDEIKYGA